MFRNCFVSARKLLVPRPLEIILLPEARISSSSAVEVNDVERRHKDRALLLPSDQRLLPSRPLLIAAGHPLHTFNTFAVTPYGRLLLVHDKFLQDHANLRLASTFQFPNPAELACNFLNMARCIDLNDLKFAPPPVFWISLATSAVQLGFPFLELVGGYSPILTYLQLYIGACSLAWNAGEKWGMALSNNPKLKTDWDTMNTVLMPLGFAISGLILPYPLGFLTVATGMLAILYCNLKECIYPPWAIASKFLVTLTSTMGLLLALMAYVLFHNRENAKNKGKAKEQPPPEDEGDENEGETQEKK